MQRLYVVDNRDHKIKVFALTGEPVLEFGGNGIGDGQFNYPIGIAIDRRNGNVVVVDSQNFRVQILDKEGKISEKVRNGRGRGRHIRHA